MRIERIDATHVRVPFRTLFSTAHGQIAFREATIVLLHTDEGRTGLGEASAVPGFGGTAAEVDAALRALALDVAGLATSEVAEQLAALDPQDSNQAAAIFALDTALHDLRGRRLARPVAALLTNAHWNRVTVNATIGAADPGAARATAEAARDRGFTCVKLKVAVSVDRDAEIARIEAVRTAIGEGVRLRLDANGGWRRGEAVAIIHAVEHLDLEWVEQPLPADDLEGMAALRRQVHAPIAADESAGTVAQVRRVIDAAAADTLIIKPMLAGSLEHACLIAALARDAGLRFAVTSTLDTGTGIAAAMHLAAALRPDVACGLATADLLVDDLLVSPLRVEQGWMVLPETPGLGIELDARQLANYTVDAWHVDAGQNMGTDGRVHHA